MLAAPLTPGDGVQKDRTPHSTSNPKAAARSSGNKRKQTIRRVDVDADIIMSPESRAKERVLFPKEDARPSDHSEFAMAIPRGVPSGRPGGYNPGPHRVSETRGRNPTPIRQLTGP